MFDTVNTYAATCQSPAGRAKHTDLLRDVLYLANDSSLQSLLDSLPVTAALLNAHRQIVISNKKMREVTRSLGHKEILELRPGEALKCVFSEVGPGGCGTSEQCRYCGALRSLLHAQKAQVTAVEECRMKVHEGGHEVARDFRVTSSPLKWSGRNYLMLSMEDISHEKRRRSMEKIFFHDLLNKTGSLHGFIDLIKRKTIPPQADDFVNIAESITSDVIEELLSYKTLLDAENGELQVAQTEVNAEALLRLVQMQMQVHESAQKKQIEIAENREMIRFQTEPVLLKRILTNMVKNALEASEPGESITLGYKKDGGGIRFHVQNRKVMPHDIQMQVFQRSFSTKGSNRGLGTYSMKLLGERYLGGKVGFSSQQGEGTVFMIWLPVK